VQKRAKKQPVDKYAKKRENTPIFKDLCSSAKGVADENVEMPEKPYKSNTSHPPHECEKSGSSAIRQSSGG
jgi:hypothetical protein